MYARSDKSAVVYDWSDESVEKNDKFEALYDWSDKSVEKDTAPRYSRCWVSRVVDLFTIYLELICGVGCPEW